MESYERRKRMRTEWHRAATASARAIGEEAVAGLQALVRIPSVTGDEATAQQWMADVLTAEGLEVDVWCPTLADLEGHPAFTNIANRDTAGRPNVVGRWRGTGGGRSLILNGHIDVVDPGARERWRYDPWGGVVVEDRLYGRGACDMKAGLLAAVYAVKALRHAGVRLRGDLLVESVIGEEEGGVGSLATLLRGYRAEAVVILEPSRLAVAPVAAGVALFRLTVEGLSAHSSTREYGVSALEKFIPLFQVLRELEREVNREVADPRFRRYRLPLSLNIHRLQTGGAQSMVPDRLVAEGRYGYLGRTVEEARRRFEARLAEVAAADPWLAEHPPKVEWLGAGEPSEASPELVDALVSAFHAVAGRAPDVEGVPYRSDMCILGNAEGLPTVIFGPGDVRQAHFPDESVPLAEYRRAIEVLAAFIVQWCGVEEERG